MSTGIYNHSNSQESEEQVICSTEFKKCEKELADLSVTDQESLVSHHVKGRGGLGCHVTL
jgi:hypothetical protein